MKGSLIIVGFFILGAIAGYTGLLAIDREGVSISLVALCLLIFCVGMGIGRDIGSLARGLRSLSPRLLLLPLATVLGTLAGCLAVWPLLPGRTAPDVLAVGSGFAYYSLSSVLITECRGAELGTIALMANISREIITLLGAPLLRRWFGPLAPISAGGATSMDTTLPIIASVCGREYSVLSIYHGFAVDFSVPFLVTLFCNI
ncbi:MAG: lysine exporter LysO family protein [Duncaniella sp.]|nr:lysine exporter LysO family protein [Duncaniella sp.]